MAYGSGTEIYHLKINGRMLCRNERASFACLTVADFKAHPKQCKRCVTKMEKLPSERRRAA